MVERIRFRHCGEYVPDLGSSERTDTCSFDTAIYDHASLNVSITCTITDTNGFVSYTFTAHGGRDHQLTLTLPQGTWSIDQCAKSMQ